MTTERTITKEQCIKLARENWRKLEGNRGYAANADVDTGLGALAAAWFEAGGSFANTQSDDAPTFDKFLAKLCDVAPEMHLRQPKPSEPLKLPELWTNPLTGERLGPPKGPDERGVLAQNDPGLLELLDEMEARPYATAKKLRDAEAKRLVQASVYGQQEHEQNVFINGSETEKSKFVREFPNLVETYQRETAPIELPFGRSKNMTIAGKIARRDAKLHAIITRADDLIRVWDEQERERLRAAKTAAEEQLKRLEAVNT
jgi:hypothetical protein